MKPSDFAGDVRPKLQDIEACGKVIPRKDFKASIAVIAKDFSDGKIDDVEMAKYFARREVNWQKLQTIQGAFQQFQMEYMTKLKDFSVKILQLQSKLEEAEVNIYERRIELNKDKKCS